MAQNYNQQPPYNQPPRESSGMGVVLGVLLAIVVAVGAYFFMQNRNVDATGLEPAAGTPAMEQTTVPSGNTADTTTGSGTIAPSNGMNEAPQQ